MDPEISADNGRSSSSVTVEADGLLKLAGRSEVHVLTPAILQRSHVLTNVSETVSEGETVPLPISRDMADEWIAAIATETEHGTLWHLGACSLRLAQTLVVRVASLHEPS